MLIKYNLPAGRQITKNSKETQKLGETFAKKILLSQASQKTAIVLGLAGNLGGGKTTFLQGFAKGLNINDKILSPTFIIYRKFQIPKFKYFYHFDCYRINKPEEILELGFEEIISNPKNIVAIEWPEKIKKFLPAKTISINFKFINEKTREINIKT